MTYIFPGGGAALRSSSVDMTSHSLVVKPSSNKEVIYMSHLATRTESIAQIHHLPSSGRLVVGREGWAGLGRCPLSDYQQLLMQTFIEIAPAKEVL